jgi:hypothetical protein
MDYDEVNPNGVFKVQIEVERAWNMNKDIELNGLVYERWKGEIDRGGGEFGGLFHQTVLSRYYAHAQWGRGVVMLVVKMFCSGGC